MIQRTKQKNKQKTIILNLIESSQVPKIKMFNHGLFESKIVQHAITDNAVQPSG